MAAPVLDMRVLSAFTTVPEASLTSLLNSPTTELVQSLLNGIESRAKEYEQSKSQKVKLEVELETVVRTNESKTKVLQNSRDKALAESSKLRVELQTSGMFTSSSNLGGSLLTLDSRKCSLTTGDGPGAVSLRDRQRDLRNQYFKSPHLLP